MRKSRRNIPDPISPQNPVIQKDVMDTNRVQDELEEKIPVEEILSKDIDQKKATADKNRTYTGSNDTNLEDES